VKSWGEIVPMPFPEFSNTEESIIHGGMVIFALMFVVRLVVKDGLDLYDECHKRMKRWRRRAP
jgi:hypothetical protein